MNPGDVVATICATAIVVLNIAAMVVQQSTIKALRRTIAVQRETIEQQEKHIGIQRTVVKWALERIRQRGK